jgi:hypothetical protein
MNGENTINANRHFVLNDVGGVTYTPSTQPGQDSGRNLLLADVRVLVAATQDLSQAHREFWPRPYPVPPDVHCALLSADYAMARVRGGALRRLAAQDFPALSTGPAVTYSIDLADLTLIADAAAELDGMRMFYVDQPGEQKRIAGIVERMRGMVERAARAR